MSDYVRQAIRFFFLGPFLGAIIGIVRESVAIHVWFHHETPDFYFHGFKDIELGYLMFSLGGFLVGIPFGLILISCEQAAGRRIQVAWVVTWAPVAAALIALVVVELKFARREIFPFASEAGAIIAAAALAWRFSKPAVLPSDCDSRP
ncbi:MAG: hypothetical protein QM775_29095 [Pirellulales bacterium]